MNNHEAHLRFLRDHPEVVGIHDTIDAYVEFPIFDSGNLVGQIDYWCITGSGEIDVVEYKSTDRPKARNKAKEQLWVARKGLKFEGLSPDHMKLLYVYDDFVFEELLESGEFSTPCRILCLYHMLGYSTNPLIINNDCYGCEPDYNPLHDPNNYTCPDFKPGRIWMPKQ